MLAWHIDVTYFTVVNPMAAENGAKTNYQAVLQYQRCQIFHISLHFLAERSGDGYQEMLSCVSQVPFSVL